MPFAFDPEDADQLVDARRWQHVRKEQFLAAVRPTRFMRLAELGAGTGELMATVLEACEGKGTFYAVERDDELRDALEARLSETIGGHRVEVEEGDDDDAPVGDGEADTVVVGFLLPELADPAAYLRVEALRIVPPGGRLVLLGWSPLDEAPELDFGTPNDARVSAEQAAELIAEAGWVEIERVPDTGEAYLFTATRPG